MKKPLVTLATAAFLLLGAGAAQAESQLPPAPAPQYLTEAECVAAGHIWAATFCYDRVAYNPPESAVPAPEAPVEVAPVPAAPAPAAPVEVPAAPGPAAQAPAAPVPAPAAPALVEVPAGTAERVAAGEELAYTGAEDVALAAGGFVIALAGAGLLLVARWMRRSEAE